MNRKQRIIVSITGIVIVVLALLGLTYAYFVTQIQGNGNDKSIEVTTANLRLIYGDGNGLISADTIMPGDTIDSKTFTVTNDGNAESSYMVVFENVAYKRVSTSETLNGFDRQEDLKYTLVCKQYDKDTPETKTDCNGVTEDIFPTSTNQSLIVTNTIPLDYIQEYTLTLNYIEAGVDQSADMDKGLSAKVNIKDVRMSNPYATISGTAENPIEEPNDTLAYNIINNARMNRNETSLVNVPLTKPAVEVSSFKYEGNIATDTTDMSISATYQDYYWTYGTGYTIDKTTGEFTLTGVQTCKYNDSDPTKACPSVLVDKYIVSNTAYDNSDSANTAKNTTNLGSVYKVVTAPANTTTTITSTIKRVTIIPYSLEKELSITQDDYGTSYYFRGGVENNYINFAGMCFRIVRIEGDGSTKIILEDSSHECDSAEYTGNWTIGGTIAYGYDTNNKVDFLNYSGGLADNFSTYQSILTTKISDTYTGKTITDYLKIDEWCYEDTINETVQYGRTHYGAAKRIYTEEKPSLKCNGKKLTKFRTNTDMYVNTLTADEVSFAGGFDFPNDTYYLFNNYVEINDINWWTLSPATFTEEYNDTYPFFIDSYGVLGYDYSIMLNNECTARPAVTLKSSVEILTGDGTIESPYILK